MVQTEQQLVEAARRGDERAFGHLIERYRARLRTRCRRILRSDHDADDALQEALVRAWRGLPGFADGGDVEAWLYRIATNASLDALARRRRTVPIDASADADAVPSAPSPAASYEQREALEHAFVAASELLPARQRAALILKDALGFSAGDAAMALGTTRTSVYSALQRARKAIDDEAPEQAMPHGRELKAAGERFALAMERADVDEILAMVRA
jgi:RNA polymerase sigma-70 factor, ECF subfamily